MNLSKRLKDIIKSLVTVPDVRKLFWRGMDRAYRRNIQRQKQFQKLVKRITCPGCGEPKMALHQYKNDPRKGEFEAFASCGACGFKIMIRHDGVMATYANQPPSGTHEQDTGQPTAPGSPT